MFTLLKSYRQVICMKKEVDRGAGEAKSTSINLLDPFGFWKLWKDNMELLMAPGMGIVDYLSGQYIDRLGKIPSKHTRDK